MPFLRIRLNFEGVPPGSKPRKCWFLLDTSSCRVVADLEYLISKRFDLSGKGSFHVISLYLQDSLLPSQEKIEVIRDNDDLRVVQETDLSAITNGVSKLPSSDEDSFSVQSPKRQKHKHPRKKQSTTVSVNKQGRMKKSSENSKIKKKSKTQRETKLSRNGATGPYKSLHKQKSSDNEKTAKNSVKQQPSRGENLLKLVSDSDCASSSSTSSSSSSSNMLASNKKTLVNPSIKSNQIRQHKSSSIDNLKVHSCDSSASSSSSLLLSKKKTLSSSSTQSNQLRQHKEKNYNNLNKISTLSSSIPERTSVHQKKTRQRSSVKSKHLKKKKERDNASISNSSSLNLSNSKKDTSTSLHVNSNKCTQQKEISSNNLDICARSEIVQDVVRQCPPQNGLIHGTVASSTVSKGHIRFDSDDSESPLEQSFSNREKENCIETPLLGDKSTVDCNISAANRLSPADTLVRPNHLIQGSKWQTENGEGYVTSKRTQRNQSREANSEGYNKDPANVKPMEYSSHKEENIAQEHEVKKKQVSPRKDYSLFTPLHGPPRAGDRIAFKILEMSSSYTPELSSYKEGDVLSYDVSCGEVELDLTRESLVKPRGDGNVSRKFELEFEEDNCEAENGAKEATEQCTKVTFTWKDMIDPRLITS